MTSIDPKLTEFATVRQLDFIEAIEKHGGLRRAAKSLGVSHGTIGNSMAELRRKAAIHGYSPDHDMTRPVPTTHIARGISTYYDGEGKVRGQWVKSSLDETKVREAQQAAFAAMAEELPRLAASISPSLTSPALCNLVTLTDSHVGMLAWGKETGEPWDLKIAEETLVGCFEHAVRNSPAAEVCFVNQLGDYLHYDSLTPVTPTHGHVLDADGRFSKMVGVAIRILRRVVGIALERHGRVVLLLAEGNHDPASAVWLRHMFRALYENEPRVEVMDSELPYYAYQHGNTMLGFHHGHLKKNEQLPILFAAKFPQVWGATSKRVIHTGHRHHKQEIEHNGVTVHQHPTLAAADAHSARSGYVSGRHVAAITYHRQFGEVARSTVTPEMLEAA